MRAFTNRFLATALTLGALGCSADPSNPCPGGGRCADVVRPDTAPTDAQMDAAPLDVVDPSQREVVALAIAPADPTLTATDGARATQAFQAVGTRRDGTTTTLAGATWTLEHDRLGAIAGDGTFTANGIAGGRVQVRVEAPGAGGMVLTASTTLTVRVERTIAGPDVPPDAASRFASPAMPDPARAPVLRYPLDNALMPNNVAPPDVQWAQTGNEGDLFRVRIVKPSVSVTAYVRHAGAAFRHDWLVDADAWRSVAESDRDVPATITVDRWDAAAMQVLGSAPVHVRLAHGSIFGVVYYWDLGGGRLQRINAVTAARENFMPNPPRRARDGRQCVACHTISRDGRMLSAELWDGGDSAAVFDLTADLSTDPAPTVFPPRDDLRYLYASFNPDGTRLVTNNENRFGMIDPRSGMSVAATGLPTGGSAHPEWSPDGSRIAHITNTDGGWAVDFNNGDLAVLPAAGTDAFGPVQVLHRGADLAGAPEGGNADSHPTWSPDARWIAFGHGTNSRSSNGPSNFPGALYLVSRDGGAPVRLDHANGGPTATHSYWPTFSPFTTTEPGGGSYFWLAFYSRRDYGNASAGTRGTGRRQLWVTAISTAPRPGEDPSHVPYWLPGQDAATENMAAYWAPLPCRMNGTSCRTSADCCSGRCNAMGMCEAPPPAECRREGATCSNTGDCCRPLECYANICGAPPG